LVDDYFVVYFGVSGAREGWDFSVLGNEDEMAVVAASEGFPGRVSGRRMEEDEEEGRGGRSKEVGVSGTWVTRMKWLL
jgi:hypothetical protein